MSWFVVKRPPYALAKSALKISARSSDLALVSMRLTRFTIELITSKSRRSAALAVAARPISHSEGVPQHRHQATPHLKNHPVITQPRLSSSHPLFRSRAQVRTSRHEQHGSATLPIGSQHWFKHLARIADCHSGTSRRQNNGCQCEHSRGRPIQLHGAYLRLKRGK